MKEYTATFEMNNGYKCSCCRETWNITMDAEFEDGTPYDEVRKYFENSEYNEGILLCIQRIGVSLGDIDELQDEIAELRKEIALLKGKLNKDDL